jgi:potassium/hydrogen antiporter
VTAHQVTVAAGSLVDGRRVEDVAERAGNVWISIVVRDGLLLPVYGDTQLRAGDLVTLLIDEDLPQDVAGMFTKRSER